VTDQQGNVGKKEHSKCTKLMLGVEGEEIDIVDWKR
jgi:hypothetical protein